ncbi:sodium/proton antiporter NhaB [Mixta mediterraneensis]|uniref:sodium/proton antiporter NhaB n=1 Tax=Mixta mediterraneensis TaxID=2758443 RepID=UPI001875D530|nr:sodium/proton antiporter NhaB [Mixta mediterraneensis]MBE5254265.1 sodium/proton antiporter NhaB [Mixta mediterraneensis]
MDITYAQAFKRNFLGQSPDWYKALMIGFLILNPLMYFFVSPFAAGWLLVIEFIFTLGMALKCHPLLPGGLLAVEAIFTGMASAEQVKAELANNLEVLLLLIFMVAGIFFMKQLLLFVFTRLLLTLRSKVLLGLTFCLVAGFLSAFLDALTVLAVVISVAISFYEIYHRVASDAKFQGHTIAQRETLDQFRAFLRSLMMQAGVGTALGGVMTMVGEPQNLIIAHAAGWDFVQVFFRMAPVTVPVLLCGIATSIFVERFRLFGYGVTLPDAVRQLLVDSDREAAEQRTRQDTLKLLIQAAIGIWLIVALAFHLAEVGLIGLSVIILATSLCGITDEHTLGQAFTEALPFTALLAVFFAVVAVIVEQHLFSPLITFVLNAEPGTQLNWFYVFNGLLSSISDNVFVGSVYINEAKHALKSGAIDLRQFELLAVATNTGTNLPSVATPNGQAAFLFLLTSALAPLIRLSYGRMVWMALPFTLVLSVVGFLCIQYLLVPLTDSMISAGWVYSPHF